MYVDWHSSNESVIDSNGKINRGLTDTSVTLTANIYIFGSSSLSVDLNNIIVKAKDVSDTAAVNSEYSALTFNTIKESNSDANNVMYYLHLPKSGLYDTNIMWSTNNNNSIDNDGSVMRSLNDATVSLIANISKGSYSRLRYINVTVKGTSDSDYLAIANAKRILTNGLILNGNPSLDNILSGLYLPSTLQGFDGLTITYSPSQSGIISSSSRTVNDIKFSNAIAFSDNYLLRAVYSSSIN